MCRCRFNYNFVVNIHYNKIKRSCTDVGYYFCKIKGNFKNVCMITTLFFINNFTTY